MEFPDFIPIPVPLNKYGGRVTQPPYPLLDVDRKLQNALN